MFSRRDDLSVCAAVTDFIEHEVLPGSGIGADTFWEGLSSILQDLIPRNKELLGERARLQRAIDHWHRTHKSDPHDPDAYVRFLVEIGYMEPVPEPVIVRPTNVDGEIATLSGPQLVVPLSNARYALNAANARWGSLYDALYGTDAIPYDGGFIPTQTYNAGRGAQVIAVVRRFLDAAAPLVAGSWTDVASVAV
jgi:malate synthase